jgi:hypothetical protein
MLATGPQLLRYLPNGCEFRADRRNPAFRWFRALLLVIAMATATVSKQHPHKSPHTAPGNQLSPSFTFAQSFGSSLTVTNQKK